VESAEDEPSILPLIEQLAASYVFKGQGIEEMCKRNYSVASDNNLEELANSWHSLYEIAKELKMLKAAGSAPKLQQRASVNNH